MENSKISRRHYRKSRGVLPGILFVLAGLILLAFNFHWIDSAMKSVVLSWPMILIAIGIFDLAKRRFIGFFFWFVPGLFFLLPRIAEAYPGSLPGISSDFVSVYWPVLLIIAGIALILKISFRRNDRRCFGDFRKTSSAGRLNEQIDRNIVFGSSENIVLDPLFNGGEINCVFGEFVLDLRKTHLPEGETFLEINSIFSGITLFIPDEWLVVPRFETVFGGVDDKRATVTPEDNNRKLIIHGSLVFGGCEIR